MNILIFSALASVLQAQRWTFDLLSALIGAGITAVLAILIYVYRAVLGRAWQAMNAQVKQTLEKLSQGVEARYYDGLLNYVAAFEVLPHMIPLEALYVAPRFITPQPYPSLLQANPLPPLTLLGPAWQATRRLIVTGRPGSGRTALLIHLTRTFVEQNRQGAFEPGGKSIPIYVHLVELNEQLSAIAPATSEQPANPEQPPAQPANPKQGAQADDPATPLIATVSSHASILISANLGNALHKWLQSDEALVLLDGLDELSPADQARAMAWISKLVEHYPKPRYVAGAPTRGYGALTDAGFAVLPLAEWDSTLVTELARRWVKIHQGGDEEAGARLAAMLKPAPGVAPLPMDLSMTMVALQKSGSPPTAHSAIYGQVVDSLLEEMISQHPAMRLSPLLSRAVLGRLATTMLKETRTLATRAEIEKIIAEVLPPEVKPTDTPQPSPAGDAAPTASKAPKGVAEAIEALTKSELLTPRGRDLHAFAHARLQSCLAAWNLTQLNDMATLTERLGDPNWADVIEFCAGVINMTILIDAYLKREDDLFRTRLWTVINWADAAPPEAAWRGRVLGEAARAWMQPDQLPSIREHALLGLISTQDKGLPYLFKKSISNPNPKLRAMAVRGLGLVGKESDLAAFMSSLGDSEFVVREAAIQALGCISGNTAIEGLVDILLQADEPMRQAAAEALAKQGEKGQKILRDAVKEEDLLVRRAAAFGLCKVGEPWAIELLTQLEHDDSQWVVRSAATEALRLAKTSEADAELNLSPVKLEEQGWLVEWGATRGMNVGLGRSAMPVLMKALTEGDAPVKLAAIRTLARIGDAEVIGPLRQTLNESDESLQTEALRALAEISARTGASVPA